MLTFISLVLIFYIFILKKKVEKDKLEYIYYRDIPTKDTPSYVGKIVKGHTDGNDIISTILDLKMRGFINISVKNVKGKEKRILSYTGKNKNIELEEHEIFLINQLFRNDNEIIFEDYIASDKFKYDFKAFDKMLERKVQRNSIKRESSIKSINKIIFLSAFAVLGISIFYAILQPIMILLIKDINARIITNVISSAIIHLGISYIYISYINKRNMIDNIIVVRITYIVCLITICLFITTFNLENVIRILQSEIIWYKIIIDFIIAVITLLYMFNMINNRDEKSYLLYGIIGMTVLEIMLNCKIAICINVVLLSAYLFMITPKYFRLKQNDYIYKWTSFKKFLEDYSMLDTQEENAILIWEKYLIYAISLGVNKKIIKKYTALAHINLFNENSYKKFYREYID